MRAADVYTHGHHESVLRSHRWRTAENSAAYLLPHLRPGLSLLDVGCGPGTITVDLARRVAPGRVVGIDVSLGAIECSSSCTARSSPGRDRLTADGLTPRTRRTAMATALALDHFVLVVSDVERALAWYGRHAGLAGVRVDEWRDGQAPFPSLRIDDATIIDLVPGEAGAGRGHLDHICFAVPPAELDALASDPDLEVVDSGERFGARGEGQSIYVHDPDGLLVEFRCYPD
jgi:catechol 2,3-dioxygenase-like lactoylglutathione lyase family enzyme